MTMTLMVMVTDADVKGDGGSDGENLGVIADERFGNHKTDSPRSSWAIPDVFIVSMSEMVPKDAYR